MQIVSSGGTMDALKAKPAATSTLEHYSPKELAGFLNALWDDQAHWPIPTDIRWEDFAPEKVMLRFKEELQRLQPYVEGWFSERGKSLPDWPKIYFVPVEGWLDYFNGNFLKDAFATTGLRIMRSFFLRYVPGAIRRAFIALPQALPRRFAHRPSRATSPAKSSFACRNGQSTSRRPRCGMTTPFSSGSGRIFRTQTSRWKSRR